MEFVSKAWFNFVTSQQAEEARRQGNTIEAVQKRVSEILEGKVVVGFDVENDFEVLGLEPPFTFLVRDIQKHFDADRCSEPDMCRLGLRDLTHPKAFHSLKKLFSAVFSKPFQTGPHSALADAQATLALYVWDRHRIDTS